MIIQNASFASLALNFKANLWPKLVSTFSCHLFPVSGQDCLAVITNFKDHAFDIPSVHRTCVGMLVDLNGTQRVRAEQALWDTRRNLLCVRNGGGALIPTRRESQGHREMYGREFT